MKPMFSKKLLTPFIVSSLLHRKEFLAARKFIISYAVKNIFVTLFMCFLVSACGKDFVQPQEVKVIEVKKAQKVYLSIKALKAEIVVSGGGKRLMVSKFHYFLPTSRAMVEYHEEAEEGNLAIFDKFNPSVGVYPTVLKPNLWSIALHDKIPLIGRIDLKEGQIIWDARKMNMDRLEMELGHVLGQFNFVKPWSQSFYADVLLEEGEVRFKVPRAIGIRIELADENQSVAAQGFKKDGKVLTNEKYEKDKPALRFYIHPGQGKILFDSIDQ